MDASGYCTFVQCSAIERPPSCLGTAARSYGKRVRRPSPAMLVALLALFVALGGPAQAQAPDQRQGHPQGHGREQADQGPDDRRARPQHGHGARAADARRTARSRRQAGRRARSAVCAIADGTVAAADIAEGAVGAGKLADSAVTGAKIADGTLTTADIARFSGAFRILAEDLGTIKAHECWSREPRGLAPELAGADISQDALLRRPARDLQRADLQLQLPHVNADATSGAAGRFVLTLCNRTDDRRDPAVDRVQLHRLRSP